MVDPVQLAGDVAIAVAMLMHVVTRARQDLHAGADVVGTSSAELLGQVQRLGARHGEVMDAELERAAWLPAVRRTTAESSSAASENSHSKLYCIHTFGHNNRVIDHLMTRYRIK